MSTPFRIVVFAVTVLTTGAGCGVGCPSYGSETFTPESLQAQVHVGQSGAIPVGASLRLGVSAIERGHQQDCNDNDEEADSAYGCCHHLATVSADRSVSPTIKSVSCEGPCKAWIDPSDVGFIHAVGNEAGTGIIVADVESDGFTTTVRQSVVFDVPESLTFTQFVGISSAKYVYLEGDTLTWCASAKGRSGAAMATDAIDVTTSGPITAGAPWDTNATGGTGIRTCVNVQASVKGRATVDWNLAGLEAHEDVDVVSVEDVRSIELVTYPGDHGGDWPLDQDSLQGIGPSTDLLYPVSPCPGTYPTLVVRFTVDGGRTGLAPKPSLTVDPPNLLCVDPIDAFIGASGNAASAGASGTLTVSVGAATTHAAVRVGDCHL